MFNTIIAIIAILAIIAVIACTGSEDCCLETHMDSASLSVLCRHGDEIVKRLSVDYSLDEDTHASRPHTPRENVRDSIYTCI